MRLDKILTGHMATRPKVSVEAYMSFSLNLDRKRFTIQDARPRPRPRARLLARSLRLCCRMPKIRNLQKKLQQEHLQRAFENAVKPTERLRKEHRSATTTQSASKQLGEMISVRRRRDSSFLKLLELAEKSCAKILKGQDEATVKSWTLDELSKQKN